MNCTDAILSRPQELPSSESEDIEDWFALDIRAERAGDYIPLLGAYQHRETQAVAQHILLIIIFRLSV